MNKIKLKDNIWIEGFDKCILGTQFKLKDGSIPTNAIYFGKTSEILEELAEECVIINLWEGRIDSYRKYNKENFNIKCCDDNNCNSAKESIQSACNQEYCIIYKVN